MNRDDLFNIMKYGNDRLIGFDPFLEDQPKIDGKKPNVIITKPILNNLKKVISTVCIRSKDKIAKKVKLTLEKDDFKIWNKNLSRSRKDVYNFLCKGNKL